MVQKQIQQTSHPINRSMLERFNLVFEYDKTLQEVKRETRIRTLNKI